MKLQANVTCGHCNGRGWLAGQPRCQAFMSTYAEYYKSIRQCRYKAKEGSKYCKVHQDKKEAK